MKKLKKTLLISSSLVLASCGPWFRKNAPEAPDLHRYGPVWNQDQDGKDIVVHWRGMSTKTGDKWNADNATARKLVMLCTDADSYNRYEQYIAELERLAEKNCRP